MKLKGILLTTALTAMLGVGVFAGVSGNRSEPVEKVEAATKSIYCKMEYSWWTDGGAAVGLHQWGGATAGTEWPGDRGSKVSGKENVWQFTVQTDRTGLIFSRVSGSGNVSDWGAQTDNLTLPEDGKDYFIMTTSSAAWSSNDKKVDGYWTFYGQPSVTVGNGQPISMSLNGSSTTEYKATITAKAGDSLTFKYGDNILSISPENASNNNYSEGGIRFGGTFDIYLKTDVNQLWAGGMPTTNGYYLMVNGIGHGQMSVNPSNPNEVQLTGAHFNANDKINILNVSGGSTYTYKNPNKNEASVAGFSKDGNDIKCTIAGYYDLYFNHSSNSLYFGESASTACVAFSNAFVAAVGLENGVCNYQGNTNLNDLKAEWVRQYDAWVELGASNQYAQGIMTAKDKTAGDELAACVAMYDYVVGKYGSALNGTSATHGAFNADFMLRNPAPIGRAITNSIVEKGSTATTTVATVMASVIAISTAAGFVFLKKKKITK